MNFLLAVTGLIGLCAMAQAQGLVPLSVYHRILDREGLRGAVPDSVLMRLAEKIEKSSDMKEFEVTEKEVFRDLERTQRRSGWERVESVLKIINSVVLWVTEFQTNLAGMINTFNLPFNALVSTVNNVRRIWGRSVRRYDGDYQKINDAIKKTMIQEIEKHLGAESAAELQRRIGELEKKEAKMLSIAYELTKVDEKAPAKPTTTTASPNPDLTTATSKVRVEGFGRSPKATRLQKIARDPKKPMLARKPKPSPAVSSSGVQSTVPRIQTRQPHTIVGRKIKKT